ncbi:hypothetical protein B0H66DRAFT_529755 [Apodospora peruviana]|uniref:Kelch repeat protein n=1 Tax=Apodospora peruviana TaxID=516989 RepID=A0AAE0IJW6_9PEZI|nr:hypothetical protein B0H66DRAFT_529755 [Apodospora peruviana]
MFKNKISLLWCCVWAASHSLQSPQMVSRQANSAVNASVFLRRAYHSSSIRSIPKPSGAPCLKNGGIWVDDQNKQLYTGFAGVSSLLGDGAYYPRGLWSFSPDGTGGGSWRNLNGTADEIFTNQPRPFDGSVASGDGSGFFLGGVLGDDTNIPNPITGVLTYNLSSQKITPILDSGSSTIERVQKGGMLYIPNFGNTGILISAGGEGGGGLGLVSGSSTKLKSLEKVQIFNPDDREWYEQKTSGSHPAPRKEFCIAGVASNHQTYEILVYAGWDGNHGSASVPFDDAYVLTLPGFHWIKANYPARHPRAGLTCNSVGGGQVMTVGGIDTKQTGANKNDEYTSVFSSPDPFTQGLAIFDLHSLAWKDSYSPGDPGSGRTPSAGFASPALETIFSQDNFRDPDGLPGGPPPGSNYREGTNAGAIAGGIVGGLAGVSLIAAFFIRRKRRHNHANRRQKLLLTTAATATTPGDTSSENEHALQNRGQILDQTQQQQQQQSQAAARSRHTNSSSRYPYSPTGFYYNEAQLPEVATTRAVPPGDRSNEKPTAGPPPAYEESETAAAGSDQVVHELPLSESSGEPMVSPGVDTITRVMDSSGGDDDDGTAVADGVPPSLPQLPELQGNSERYELP